VVVPCKEQPSAGAAGVNVGGMEQAAAQGDTSGVLGHTVVPTALAVALLAAEGAMSVAGRASEDLRAGAREQYAQALAPTKQRTKYMMAKRTPEMLDRDIRFRSPQELADRAGNDAAAPRRGGQSNTKHQFFNFLRAAPIVPHSPPFRTGRQVAWIVHRRLNGNTSGIA
jgi:hypothetical protein